MKYLYIILFFGFEPIENIYKSYICNEKNYIF